jgi:hypothetical protein
MEVRSLEPEAGKYKETSLEVIAYKVLTEAVISFESMQAAFY